MYSPALTDYIFMVENTSYMFVTGPNVVKTVTNEDVSSEDLGGASVHGTKSGVAHFTAPNEVSCLNQVKQILQYLPQNCEDPAPSVEYDSKDEKVSGLNGIVPENPNQPYDMREVIELTLDANRAKKRRVKANDTTAAKQPPTSIPKALRDENITEAYK